MLRDIAIQNYRSFKDFQIDDLARVNLIVGANNSGKTSLLEAIYLLVNQSEPGRLGEILVNRGEIAERTGGRSNTDTVRRPGYQLTHIFHGRQPLPSNPIKITSKQDRPLLLRIMVQPSARQQRLPMSPSLPVEDAGENEEPIFEVVFNYGPDSELRVPMRDDGSIDARALRFTLREGQQRHQFLATDNLAFGDLAELWDIVHLTPEEDKVVEALQILDPAVERIGFASRQTSNSGIRLKLHDQTEPVPVPLGSMGDGMRRILTLATAEIVAENGVLLVDEIDTGLYYRAQTNMWRLLIQTAQRLNVQIFATTHSLDCVQAFQAALSGEKDEEVGKLFRLSVRGDSIQPVAYTARDLEIAIQQEIEVR
jgi:ABC-type branched-subunit amino acid transport system ATPase component